MRDFLGNELRPGQVVVISWGGLKRARVLSADGTRVVVDHTGLHVRLRPENVVVVGGVDVERLEAASDEVH